MWFVHLPNLILSVNLYVTIMGASSIIFNSLGVGPVVTFFDKIPNRESGQDDEFPPKYHWDVGLVG